eukprot:jgi/Galph1/2161/GphlegSOOS_G861.1
METIAIAFQTAVSQINISQWNQENKKPFYTLKPSEREIYLLSTLKRRPSLVATEDQAMDSTIDQIVKEVELLFALRSENLTGPLERLHRGLLKWKTLKANIEYTKEEQKKQEEFNIEKKLEPLRKEWFEHQQVLEQEIEKLQSEEQQQVEKKWGLEKAYQDAKEKLEVLKREKIEREQMKDNIAQLKKQVDELSKCCEQQQDELAKLEDAVAEKMVYVERNQKWRDSNDDGQEHFTENLRLQHLCQELRVMLQERKETKKAIIQKDLDLQTFLRTINQEALQTSQKQELVHILERRLSILEVLLQKTIHQHALDNNLYAQTIEILLQNNGILPLESLKEQVLSMHTMQETNESNNARKSQILQVIYTLVANSLIAVDRSQQHVPVTLSFSMDVPNDCISSQHISQEKDSSM